jgi:hypothetical protein
VSVYDYITPSEQAAELGLLVNRVRRNCSVREVPVLVVEGATDRALFTPHTQIPDAAIFAAGTRQLVEQLLRHLQKRPISGCRCAFLVDCDGRGKTSDLSNESSLLVTQACDVEADLVHLGVAERVVRRFTSSDHQAGEFVDRASTLAMPVSVVRRAAHSASISMKKRGKQLRLRDLGSEALDAMERDEQSPADALGLVAHELEWGDEDKEVVAARLTQITGAFDQVCLGKDALDALHWLLGKEGSGEVRGWTCDHFHQVVREGLRLSDFADWEVGRRLYAWQHETGCSIVHPAVST